MQLSISTPALLFSTASLVMLGFSNRFTTIANLIRQLHADYREASENKIILLEQIRNLQFRVRLIRNMQVLGVSSLFISILSMISIYAELEMSATVLFGAALLLQALALGISVYEITISVEALKIELSDIEHLMQEESGVRRFRDVLLRRTRRQTPRPETPSVQPKGLPF